jgi:hypothetical protein
MTVAPKDIDDKEQLNRRIHPTFVKPDGTVSSQAFTDLKMSVDRAEYRKPKESLLNYNGYGLAGFLTQIARKIGQDVYSEPELLNFAHAIVEGKKTKSIARSLVKAATWVVPISVRHAQSSALGF